MTNIIILCGGPPKIGRERHLEVFNGNPLINNIIDNCMIESVKIYVLIHKDNINLKNHILKNYGEAIGILESDTLKMYDTFKLAFSVGGRCMLIMGDLINLQKRIVNDFLNTKYSSAIARYKHPWGSHKVSIKNKLIRRGDIGDCITVFSEEDTKKFISIENYENAIKLFYDFYPHKKINFEIQNDIGTFMSYSFFYKIVSNPSINEYETIGTIYCDYKVYADND